MTFAIFLVLPAALIALGLPIFIVLLSVAVAGILHLNLAPLGVVHSTIFGGLDSFPLLAIPLFILAGDLMAKGGIARRLIDLIMSVVGGIRGSMGVASIGSASAFGAMSGSAVACVAAIGKLTVPTLVQQGYGRRFSVSMIAATGVIDIIIPPSISMILYGITAQVSVTKLFIAGFLPGILIALLLSAFVVLRAKVLDIPLTGRAEWRVIAKSFRSGIWAVLAPVIIIGGIYGGIFTPTEAAGIACTYAVIVSVFIYRELNWIDVWNIVVSSTLLIAQIMILVGMSTVFGWVITTSGMPQMFVQTVQALDLHPWTILLIFNVVLLLVGSVLEPSPAILILTPLLAPVMQSIGVDLIHFGLVMTINLAIGMFLPPFGINLFAANAIFNVPLPQLYRGVLPFLLIYLIVLALITYVPALTTIPVGWVN